MFKLIFFLLIGYITGDKILLLIDNAKIKQTHSTFIKSLEERGHALTIKMADDPTLLLIKYGELAYDHLLLLAPSVDEFGGSVNVQEITKFIDNGGNVLITGDVNLGDSIRELANEVGFEFDEEKSEVIDHHNYDMSLDQKDHTTIVVPSKQLINAELIVGNKDKINPILYRGTGLIVNTINKLRLNLLTAPTTAYSYNPSNMINEIPSVIGKNVVLIGAIQARNNARVVITGSLSLFSDEFLNANVNKFGSNTKSVKSGNFDLVKSLSKWVLKEVGLLKVDSVKHSLVGETKPPSEYTIMDYVNYEITIKELKNGKWVPFQATDVQLEFVRIDPFVRTTLKNQNGKFSTTFKVPDVYGVYKFFVDYYRVGYTHLQNVQQVSVRPFTHTQYERFSRCAYPYYASALSMIIGVVLFSFVFLYFKDINAESKESTLINKK